MKIVSHFRICIRPGWQQAQVPVGEGGGGRGSRCEQPWKRGRKFQSSGPSEMCVQWTVGRRRRLSCRAVCCLLLWRRRRLTKLCVYVKSRAGKKFQDLEWISPEWAALTLSSTHLSAASVGTATVNFVVFTARLWYFLWSLMKWFVFFFVHW